MDFMRTTGVEEITIHRSGVGVEMFLFFSENSVGIHSAYSILRRKDCIVQHLVNNKNHKANVT